MRQTGGGASDPGPGGGLHRRWPPEPGSPPELLRPAPLPGGPGGSLLAGFLAVLFGSLLGVPLAYFGVKTAAGVVRAGIFQGAAVQYEVLLGGGQPVRVNTATSKGQRLFPPGAEVAVCFDPADVILIPQEDQ